MKIMVAGFDSVREAVAAINKWVEETQIFLFTIVCVKNSMAERIAEELGASAYFLKEMSGEELVQKLPGMVDYGILKYDGENAYVRRLIMGLKMEGKHGWVVKSG